MSPHAHAGPAGLVVVDKPQGWTSHQVVGRLRRVLGTRKVGHAGTLDPMATGVLLVGVGRATRLLGHLMLTEKEYTATIRLGVATVTDDAEGQLTQAPGADGIDAVRVRERLGEFTGPIAQAPSAVSAIKVDGQRSYARVRAGEQVELAPRPVTVYEFTLLATRAAHADGVAVLDCDVRVRCSSGTYIRALARDLGRALGSAGHLTALRRTRVGPFGADVAEPVDERTETVRVIGLDEVVTRCFATVALDEAATDDVRHGRRLAGRELPAELLAMMNPRGNFLALYRRAGTDAVAEAVFAPANGEDG